MAGTIDSKAIATSLIIIPFSEFIFIFQIKHKVINGCSFLFLKWGYDSYFNTGDYFRVLYSIKLRKFPRIFN